MWLRAEGIGCRVEGSVFGEGLLVRCVGLRVSVLRVNLDGGLEAVDVVARVVGHHDQERVQVREHLVSGEGSRG